MKFRTEIEPLDCRGTIDLGSRIVMIGSCFTDNIGRALSRHMFDVAVNPFGTLFNPVSMAMAVEEALDKRAFTADDLIAGMDRFVTLRRHSAWSDTDAGRLLEALNRSADEAAKALRTCDVFIATFGSAIAFRDNVSGEIVANCHKLPASRFTREEISVNEIVGSWSKLINRLKEINPTLRIILTVSPVRHAGYGLTADRLSKSRLLVAVDELTHIHPDAVYFPSYEIMVDDLRDYRFYADDLVHPSAMAVNYIFDLFVESFVEKPQIQLARQWEKLTRRAAHRHSGPAETALAFARETDRLASALASQFSEKYPGLYDRFKKYVSSCQQA